MSSKHLFAVLMGFTAVAILTADATGMYHPALGRFMQRDPGPEGGFTRVRIGAATPAAGGHPARGGTVRQYADGMHLYQYVRGNPVRWRDPTGTHTFINCDNWCCYGEKVDKADLEQRVNQASGRAKVMRDQFERLAEIDRTSSVEPGALQRHLGRIQRRLDGIVKTLSDARIKCGGLLCGPGTIAYVWPFGKTIHLCCPFTLQSTLNQIGTLIHEGSHIHGTLDPPSRMRDQKPTNPWWLENPENAEAYEWWAEHEQGDWF